MDMDDPALTAWLAITRAIHFICCLLIAGVWFSDRLVIIRSTPAWRRSVIGMLLVATPLALLSGIVWFALVAANMADVPFTEVVHRPELLRQVWAQTRFGHTWEFHLLFWVAGAIAVAVFMAGRRIEWVNLLFAAGLVASLAWAGHGSTGPAPRWHLTMDVIHLLTASVWPMGLLPLVLLIRQLARSDDADRRILITIMTRRFSLCSLTAISLLTLTGIFNSWCLLGSPGVLFTTHYGRVLLAKLTFFCVMIGLGAVNMLVLTPRIIQHANVAKKLARNIAIEILLGTAVLGAVGLLGTLEPAHSGQMHMPMPANSSSN